MPHEVTNLVPGPSRLQFLIGYSIYTNKEGKVWEIFFRMNDDSSHTPLFSVYLSSKGRRSPWLKECISCTYPSFRIRLQCLECLERQYKKSLKITWYPLPPRGPAYPGSSDVIHVYKSLKFSLTILCNLHLKWLKSGVKEGPGNEAMRPHGVTWLYIGVTWLYIGVTWLYTGVTWLYTGVTWLYTGVTWLYIGVTWLQIWNQPVTARCSVSCLRIHIHSVEPEHKTSEYAGKTQQCVNTYIHVHMLLCCIFTRLRLVKIQPHTHVISSHIASSPIKYIPPNITHVTSQPCIEIEPFYPVA